MAPIRVGDNGVWDVCVKRGSSGPVDVREVEVRGKEKIERVMGDGTEWEDVEGVECLGLGWQALQGVGGDGV